MTLQTVPEYDPESVSRVGDHAVVVGASMAGLLAARVLADGFETVTVFDRDPLPTDAGLRRGVPQASHVHVMLEPGRQVLESFFPEYSADLRSAGGLDIDAATDLGYYHRGGFLADGPDRLPMLCASRPLFEDLTRRKLAETDGVTLRGECHVTEYVTGESDDGATIEGVTITDSDGATERVHADLTVDATGRTSRTPDWLERHHYAPPVEDRVTVDLAYSTVTIARPPENIRGVLIAPSPPLTRGGTAIPIEDDRWVVTLFGLHGDHPPTDPDEFVDFAEGLPSQRVHEWLDTHEWVSDQIQQYPFPASLRRRYEDLHRFPEGLLVTGDAIASFNPIYGQGMSVAALDALHLHHALADRGLDDIAPRFFERAGDTLDTIWTMTVSADFEFEATAGPKPTATGLRNAYLSRVIRTAQTDGVVSDRFARVLRLEQPPTALVSPDVLWRVLAPQSLRKHV